MTEITDETIMRTCVRKDGCTCPSGYKDEEVRRYLCGRYSDIPEEMFSYPEVVQRIIHHIDTRPVCEVCGKPVKYINRKDTMYASVCSQKCSHAANEKKMKAVWEKRTIEDIEEIQKKTKQTCKERYGVEYSFQSDNNKEKADATREAKYGDKNFGKFGSESFKSKMLAKYGFEHPQSASEVRAKISKAMSGEASKNKMRATVLSKYGVSFVSQDAKIQEKINESYKLHGTFNSSKDEEQMAGMLADIFGNDDVVRGYSSAAYPFKCDFYVKSLDLYVEYQGSMFHNFKRYNPARDKKEMLSVLKKCSASEKPNRYDNLIETWTRRDICKWETANANDIKMAFIYPGFHEKWMYYKSHSEKDEISDLYADIKGKLKDTLYNVSKPISIGERIKHEQLP